MTNWNKPVHFWIAPKLAGETDLISPNTACGLSMYPDAGDRRQHSEDALGITCGNCTRSQVVKNLIWFDWLAGQTEVVADSHRQPR